MEGIGRESGICHFSINFAHNNHSRWKAGISTLFLHSDLCFAGEATMQMEGPSSSSSSSQVSKSKILPSFP